jgi:hypothetical protein
VLLARAVGDLGDSAGGWSASWDEVMNGKSKTADWEADEKAWGWMGLKEWPSSGTIEMKCYGYQGGSSTKTYSQTYTLDKGDCASKGWSRGCATFDFEWNQGCYGSNGRGYDLTTNDLDRDVWGNPHGSCNGNVCNCAAKTGRTNWQEESAGWGWHGWCGCGSIYKLNGKPMCMGGDNYDKNEAERVEMWIMDADMNMPFDYPYHPDYDPNS